jgi:hypothetical protein
LTGQPKILISVFCIVILAAMLIGCGGNKTESTTTALADVITQYSARMQTLTSYHFLLDQVGGGTPLALGVEMKKAEGDIISPDKLKTTLTGTVSGFTVQVQIISVGGVLKMTNPLNGQWETPSSSFSVLSIFDPHTGIAAILKGVANVSKLDDAQAGGVLCYHLNGTIQSENLSAITGSAITGTSITTQLWIGKDDLLVRNVQLTGQITETEVQGIVRTLSFSNFNESITIDLPQ